MASLNLDGLDVSALVDMFANSDVDLEGIFENCDYSSLDGMVLDLTGLLESSGTDLADYGVDVSDYDLSAIALPDLIGIISNLDIDMSEFDLSSLDLGGFDISGLIKNFNLSSLDLSSIFGMFNITGFNLTEFMKGFDLNKLLNLFMKNNTENKTTPDTPSYNPVPNYSPVKSTYYAAPKVYTVTRLSDNQLICKSSFFILDHLNKLFNMTFINGHLKVYIDGKLVFEGDTTDDLTMVIFEIIEEYLGEHDIKVEFTDSEGKSNTFEEKVMVE